MKYLIIFFILFSFSFNLSAKRKRYKRRKTCTTRACKLRAKKAREKKAREKKAREKKVREKKAREKRAEKKIVHKLITNAKLNIPIDISLKYRNESGGDILIFLHYATFFDPKWQIAQMELIDGTYQATIPADYVLKGGVIYYIEVIDEFEDIIDKIKTELDPQYINVKEISEKKIDKENKKRKIKKRKKEKKKIDLMIQEEFALFNQDDLEVVTASKKSQKSIDAPAIITVISSNMIEKMGAITLLDILNYIPSINTKLESNGKLRASIRGVEKDGNILLMINGSRINNLYDSNAIYDLPATFIKRVEIIRGPGSALFGTDAVAGIINVITDDSSNEAIYSMGINNNYSLGLNYSAQRYGYKISLLGGILNSSSKQELNKDYFYTKEWSLTYNGPTKIKRTNQTAYLSTSIKSNDLTISFLGIQQKYTDWIGPVYVATTDSLYVNTRAKLDTSYELRFGNVTITPKIYGDFLDNDNLIQTKPDGYISSISGDTFKDGALTKETYQIYSIGGDLQVNIDFNNFNIITGTTWQYFKVNDYDLKRNYKIAGEEYHDNQFELYDTDSTLEQKNKDRTVMALFLQADYKFSDFAITAGVRGDYYDDIGVGENALIFSAINPRLGIVYRLGDSTIIKALYGEAFRAPTFKELYDQTDKSKQGITGNKELDPEKVKTIELAFETKIWNIKFKSNIFYNMSDNIISPFDVDGSGSVGTYENIGSTRSYGIESELITEFKFINFFTNFSWFSKSFIWNDDIWKFGSPVLTDREALLTDVPMRKVNIGINVRDKKLNIFLGITNVSHSMNNHRMALEDLSTVYIPSYWSFDINLSYLLTKQLTFSLIGRNIGYSHYTAPSNSNNIDDFGDKGMIQPNFFWISKLIYKFDMGRK